MPARRNNTSNKFSSAIIPLKTSFEYKQRRYICGFFETDSLPELRIKNSAGKVLVIEPGQTTGLLGNRREDAESVDIFQPHFYNLVQAALNALEIAKS